MYALPTIIDFNAIYVISTGKGSFPICLIVPLLKFLNICLTPLQSNGLSISQHFAKVKHFNIFYYTSIDMICQYLLMIYIIISISYTITKEVILWITIT